MTENKNDSRRDFIRKSATLALGTIVASSFASDLVLAPAPQLMEGSQSTEGGKFTLPPLPYDVSALEPHIDKLTMEIHYTKHHQGYVNNLNKALETVDVSIVGASPTLEVLFKKMDQLPVAVRNNAGGHYNHSLFWTLMHPAALQDNNPSGKLEEAIKATFGSVEGFKKQFAEAAAKRFGSGWAWLLVNNGKLVISSTANQDNPLMNIEGVEVKGSPVLALDVWEHAYYLKNQNRRGDYITSWWNVVNWKTAEALYAKAV